MLFDLVFFFIKLFRLLCGKRQAGENVLCFLFGHKREFDDPVHRIDTASGRDYLAGLCNRCRKETHRVY